MPAKLSVLRAIRRVLRPGGRTAFTTIFVTPGLDRRAHRRARDAGPTGAVLRSDYRSLLASAGFDEIEERDLTAEYEVTQRGWLVESERHGDGMAEWMGAQELDERQAERRVALAAIEDGLLRRSLFVARRPLRRPARRRS